MAKGGGDEGSIPPGLLAAAERVRGAGKRTGKRGRAGKSGGGGGRFGTGGRRAARLSLLTSVLAVIAAALVLVIAAGTLYALLRDPESFPPSRGTSAETAEAADGAASGPGMFTGIGRMRIAAGPGATVILSIVFPYPPDDRPFTEELASKVPLFRQIARDYFGALSLDELDSLDEQKAKDEILRGFNSELRLGRIELLYFNDLLILE